MNENDFFIGATLRICSSLEIEEALWKCLTYIRDYLPADELHILHHDTKNKTISVIASATVDGGTRPAVQIPMAQDYFTWTDDLGEFWIANDVEDHYMMKHYLRYVNKESSCLNLRLVIGKQFIGALFVIARGKNRFTEDHAKRLLLLKEPFGIAVANSLKHQEVLKLQDILKDDNRYLQTELLRLSGNDIIGKNAGLRGVMEAVEQVASLQTPVLLIGETGTGKEIIANAIHSLSPRRDRPFIKVNCGAIPETIIDSELFGHERGAFTGAVAQKRGHFERAHEGTILLDEIGELPHDAQVRMLRVLQDMEILRVGGSKPVRVNVRVIAATHRNLEELVQAEKFRRDLYFRLRIFPIFIPPLKERKKDIPNLTQHFIDKKSKEMGITGPFYLADGALDRLIEYDWPGNVRELENAVERTLILRKNRILDFKDMIDSSSSDIQSSHKLNKKQSQLLDQVIADEIQKALSLSHGRVEGRNGAAEILGLKPNTLRSRMKKLGIPFGRKSAG
jgi:transcriptional regulator with GAF, ATPase, and Fis domain